MGSKNNMGSKSVQDSNRIQVLVRQGKACRYTPYKPLSIAVETNLLGIEDYCESQEVRNGNNNRC